MANKQTVKERTNLDVAQQKLKQSVSSKKKSIRQIAKELISFLPSNSKGKKQKTSDSDKKAKEHEEKSQSSARAK
jgi:hypothetical protein